MVTDEVSCVPTRHATQVEAVSYSGHQELLRVVTGHLSAGARLFPTLDSPSQSMRPPLHPEMMEQHSPDMLFPPIYKINTMSVFSAGNTPAPGDEGGDEKHYFSTSSWKTPLGVASQIQRHPNDLPRRFVGLLTSAQMRTQRCANLLICTHSACLNLRHLRLLTSGNFCAPSGQKIASAVGGMLCMEIS